MTELEQAGATPKMGAVVVAFPTPPARNAQLRLDRAMVALQRATEQQAIEMAAWRDTLVELDRSIAGLAGTVVRYQSVLSEVAGRVEELGGKARLLETCVRP